MWFYRQLTCIISLLHAASVIAAIPPVTVTDEPTTTTDHNKLASHRGLPEGYDSSRYIITYKNSRGAHIAERASSKVHVRLERQNAMAVSIPSRVAVERLRKNPNIEDIEEDGVRYMMDRKTADATRSFLLRGNQQQQMQQTRPYGIEMVQADQVSLGNDPVTVCVIDSGYRVSHPDLPSNVDGYDGNLPWAVDNDGHGSHVAGTIAAMNNNEGVVGVAPGVDLFIVRVFGDDGNWAYSSDLVDAMNRCVTGGAKIINMSLGGNFQERFENRAFRKAFHRDNVLSIAAAGNDGNTRHSFPASYDSVISVAALDSTKTIADFSQQTSEVELAAPGVNVNSTTVVIQSDVEVGGESFNANHIDFSTIDISVTGNLCNCALALDTCDCTSGDVCLIERGEITFFEKTVNCRDGGGAAAVIYNNEPGNFFGTLGDPISPSIPAVSLSQADGQALSASFIGQSTTVTAGETIEGYFPFDGTSMAAPHVAGVAALAWSHFPACSNCEIRNALVMSAEDLGPEGRDDAYGYGLVQAKAAVDYLSENGCTGDRSFSICQRRLWELNRP